MSLIVTIRGTGGSGKSTIVKAILDAFAAQPIRDAKGKDRGYVCPDVAGVPLYVLGPYLTPCGGCDSIATQDEVCNLIREWTPKGNVLFEGLLISGLFRRYNELEDELAEHHFIHGFLDTPLQRCIDLTLARRAARGNHKPFDPGKTLEPKFRAVLSSRRKFEAAKRDVRTIHHWCGFEVVLSWLQSFRNTSCTFSEGGEPRLRSLTRMRTKIRIHDLHSTDITKFRVDLQVQTWPRR